MIFTIMEFGISKIIAIILTTIFFGKNLEFTECWGLTPYSSASRLDADLLDWKAKRFIKLDAVSWSSKNKIFPLVIFLPGIMIKSTRVRVVYHARVASGAALIIGAKIAWKLRAGDARCGYRMMIIVWWNGFPSTEP